MVTPPNFKPGVGRLATDRYDFQSHLEGTNPTGKTDFRHTADQIDIIPIPNLGSGTNIDDVLNNLGIFVGSQLSKGEGFITVGEGYDSWANSNALTQIYFDNTTPYLDDLLNPIFQAILDNGIGTGLEINPLPAAYERIKRGGIVLIRSGTYIVKAPIIVPPGIVIVGEGFGTKIINVSSLTLTPLPPTPKVTPTPAPVFRIISDGYRNISDSAISGGNSLPTDYRLFTFGRKTVISNLIISDNFVENTILGDTFYKIPQNKTGNNPLILQEQGSNLILDNVYLMGRVNFSSGQIVSLATRFAIQLDGYSPNQNGTFLKINNSFIDGFSIPVDFRSSGGSNDHLEITNNKIRAFGYLDGNGNGTTNPESNCILRMNDNNAIITGNYLYGNSDSITSAIFIESVLGASVNVQAESKIIMTGNNITIDRSKNSTNTTFKYLRATAGATTTNYSTRITSTIYGNVFQGSVGFEVSKNLTSGSGSQFNITDTAVNVTGDFTISGNVVSNLTISGSLVSNGFSLINDVIFINAAVKTTSLTIVTSANSPYAVLASDYIILANTSAPTITINLPDAALNTGRNLIIKDYFGNGSNINITINATGGQIIDGQTSKVISTDYGIVKLLSNGFKWLII